MKACGTAIALLTLWFAASGFPAGAFAQDPEPTETNTAAASAVPARVTERESIPETIERFLSDAWERDAVVPSAVCSDETFVRRIHLDLIGRVPSVAEIDSFLADESIDKRATLAEHLANSREYSVHFADVFDALLMGRGADHQYAKRRQHGWRTYLENVFAENRPWDKVAREVLLARPEKSNSGAVWFLYERDNKHQAIAEAIAPAFFGIRIECAQCHDHMIVDEITQADYWGLVAFFNRSKNESTPNGPRMAESAIGGFSEFADLTGDSTPNHLTFVNADTVVETRPKKGEEQKDSDENYVAAENNGDPRIPKFSRRERFVDEILSEHPLVAKAMVNRLWAILMGRGIVHPFDEIDSVHPASHPELLQWLTDDFVASGFDIRRLVIGITQSQPYQLSSVQPESVDDPSTFAWYLERPLTAEQYARSIQMVARNSAAVDQPLIKSLRGQLKDVLPDETVVSISDALYLTNNETLNQFLAGSTQDAHLLGRLMKLDDLESRADELVRNVLGRHADAEERQALVEFFEPRRNDPQSALVQALWSLVTSAEFRFNH